MNRKPSSKEKTMKRKPSRSERLRDTVARADQQDEMRRNQIGNQMKAIENLLSLIRAMSAFIEEAGQTEAWEAYRNHASSEPCYICGRQDNHFGVPHSQATNDGRTRADVKSEDGET